MRERVLVIRAEGEQARGIRALEPRYPDLEFVYCESFLSGIVEASRGSVRAMLARVDGGPRRLTEAVGALREAGGGQTKIVLCCSPEHEPQAREALAGGADDYVIEPVQAADVDRAIGYARLTEHPLTASLARTAECGALSGAAPVAAEPARLMEDLAALAELLGLMDAPPRAMLQKAADFISEAMGASGATIVVQGTAVQNGHVVRPVLTAVLRDGERVVGQVSVGERRGTEGSRVRGNEGKVEKSQRRTVETSDGSDSGFLVSAYTIGDAQRLEQYAGVLGRVIAAAGRQRELRRLAVMDEASGLPNRRYLREQLAAILQRAAAERFPVTVLLFDVDDFKAYNDRFGHDAGDEILRVTGELFRKNCREQDVVARYGGDEFGVVFYDPHGPREAGSKPPAEALFVLDRFKDELATLRVNVKTSKRRNVKTTSGEATSAQPGLAPPRSGRGVDSQLSGADGEAGMPEHSSGHGRNTLKEAAHHSTITISGGLATYPWDGTTVDALLRAADEALLAAKRAGKNRIFVVGQ